LGNVHHGHNVGSPEIDKISPPILAGESTRIPRVSSARFFGHLMTVSIAAAFTMSVARPGHAFCRAVSEPIPDTWQQDVECFTGSDAALEVYWKNACAGYSLQKNASKQVSLAQATAIAAKAFAAWKNVDCPGGGHPSIDATHDMGPVDCSAVQYNEDQPNQNLIVFRDEAWPHPGQFNTLGLTRLKYGASTGEIFDADMEINAADHTLVVDGPAGTNEVLLESVITHEAGHFLGLGHSTQSDAIMFAKYHGDTTMLSDDDKAGICEIYPPDGTRKAKQASGGAVTQDPCDPEPRNGWSSACGSPSAGGGGGGGAGASVVADTLPPIHRSACSVSPAGISENWIPLFVFSSTVLATLRRLRRAESLAVK
jgi:hypothetical protein